MSPGLGLRLVAADRRFTCKFAPLGVELEQGFAAISGRCVAFSLPRPPPDGPEFVEPMARTREECWPGTSIIPIRPGLTCGFNPRQFRAAVTAAAGVSHREASPERVDRGAPMPVSNSSSVACGNSLSPPKLGTRSSHSSLV
jgi:hypothetical protein